MNNVPPIDYTHVPDARELEQLVQELETTFKANMYRHEGLLWKPVERRIAEVSTKTRDVIRSLNLMVKTLGMPDVVDFDQETGKFRFRDCSPESPEGRRCLAYDQAAESKIKKYYPQCDGNVLDTSAKMGIEVLDEDEYREAQKVNELDNESSSFIKTPDKVRKENSVLEGYRYDNRITVWKNHPYGCSTTKAFRGALWL